MTDIYNYSLKKINGEETKLEAFKGKVLLIVNVASKCGFTPQYKGLQSLHEKYQDKGFAVLGFPCNQFGAQEPGDEEEIKGFCEGRFGVNFPLFSKVDVNGDQAHPLFDHLKKEAPGLLGSKAIKWNFTKFLVDQNGKVLKRFAPKDKPESIDQEIENLLNS